MTPHALPCWPERRPMKCQSIGSRSGSSSCLRHGFLPRGFSAKGGAGHTPPDRAIARPAAPCSPPSKPTARGNARGQALEKRCCEALSGSA